MPTVREARYAQLRRAGFLKSEAMAFSHFDYRAVPYIAQLVSTRSRSFQTFNTNNMQVPPKERLKRWEDRIRKLCQQNGWTKQWKGQTVIDPWAELRAKEDVYKPKNRDYASPHQKRWRDFQAFDRKLEKSLQYS